MRFFPRKKRPKKIAEIPYGAGLFSIVVYADHRLLPSPNGTRKYDRGYRLHLELVSDSNNSLLQMAAIEAGFPVETMLRLQEGETISFSRISGQDSASMNATLEKVEREIEAVWPPRFHQRKTTVAIRDALLMDMKSIMPSDGCPAPSSRGCC